MTTLTSKDYYNNVRKYKKELIKVLRNEKYRGGVMICKHNSILCIKNTDTQEIEFIIDTSKDRGLIMMNELDSHLSVPRYEPKVAKQWLKEELSWNRKGLSFEDEDFSKQWESKRVKVILSEQELRQEYKKYLLNVIETNKMFAKVF